MGSKKNKNHTMWWSFHANQHPKTPEAFKRPLCLGPSSHQSETEMEELKTSRSKNLR